MRWLNGLTKTDDNEVHCPACGHEWIDQDGGENDQGTQIECPECETEIECVEVDVTRHLTWATSASARRHSVRQKARQAEFLLESALHKVRSLEDNDLELCRSLRMAETHAHEASRMLDRAAAEADTSPPVSSEGGGS